MSRYNSSAGSSSHSGSRPSTNPFDSNADAAPSSGGSGAATTAGSKGRLRRGTTTSSSSPSAEPAIWAARNVEWPIPGSLSANLYQKLLRASRQAAQQLGIKEAAFPSVVGAPDDGSHFGGGGGAGGGGAGDGPSSGPDGDGASNKYYGGLVSGFMSRVLNTSAASDRTDDDLLDDGANSNLASPTGGLSSVRPLRPPRTGCVAAANGWIVAALECPHAPHSSSASTSSSAQSCLRLISRWNVRRGGGLADPWIALPPPTHGDGRIAHVLVDPTASHILISAYNGEAYYLHASQKIPTKLPGFGDPTLATLTGVPASAVPASPSAASSKAGTTAHHLQQRTIQLGLTPHTYVTTVAWDKERGTEGRSKKILLGTSGGEIYEYSLSSPNADDAEAGGAPITSSSGTGGSAPALPMLLHQLHRDPETSSGGAAASAAATSAAAQVSGIYLERLRTGLLVLVASSGRRKRTRFGTFYSAHSTNLALPFQATAKNSTLTELPGSVDFADLRVCGDAFGLRTATGIYYGRIDRNYTTVSGSNAIVESGILPYANQDHTSEGGVAKPWASHPLSSQLPVSLALTPHHLITLSEANEVRFVNRVALKVVQRERVELMGGVDEGGVVANSVGAGELLMDIRRPDQVWLRRGRSLVHISASQEDRDVWKFTLQKCLDMPVSASASPRAKVSTVSSAALIGTCAPVLSDEEKAQESLFEQAKALCTNVHQKAVVTAIRAEYHLRHGRAELAAKYLAQCPASLEPFADAAVRLALPKLGVEETPHRLTAAARESLEASNLPLIAYLSEKMRVGTMNDDKMTSTMIGAWLTELYLHERGERVGHAVALADSGSGGATATEVEAVHSAMLARFLNSHVNHMDAKTIMKILTSHDVGAGECAVYAARSGDISTAVNAALSVRGDDASGAFEALQILDDAPFELSESLYYKHAPILLARAPLAAGESFLNRYAQGLNPNRLLPSIMHYERARAQRRKGKPMDSMLSRHMHGGADESKGTELRVDMAQGSREEFELQVKEGLSISPSFVDEPSVSIDYLEGVIKRGCRSSAVLSYLVSLYAKLDDEEPLYMFLSTHVPQSEFATEAAKKAALCSGNWRSTSYQDDFSSPLDMSFALRTVLGTGRHFRSAIKLYMGFGMRQQAVELALKVDPSLARELAQDSVELDERKRLWLMIAKNAASDSSTLGGKDVVSRVVSVLKDCGPDVLSIEDVLPFLPDFAQIDQIKDEICEALTSYSSKIESFLKEMSDCDRTCDNLREEIRRLRNHRMRMRGDARCAYTNRIALEAGEPFYIFPSGYVVLSSALKKEVMPYLNERQKTRVTELEGLLSNRSEGDGSSLEELQTELDGLIAAECPLTGSVMVESIDRDFEDGAEIDEVGGYFALPVERVDV